MDRTEEFQRCRETALSPDLRAGQERLKPKIEPESWRDVTEFRDQNSEDAVFEVLADPECGHEGFWIVRDIKKIRPAAVPIDQPPTFDFAVLNPGGEVVGQIRLTIEEVEQIRSAEPSGVS